MITLFDLFILSFTDKESEIRIRRRRRRKKKHIILIENIQAIIITVLLLLVGTCRIVEWMREEENNEQ